MRTKICRFIRRTIRICQRIPSQRLVRSFVFEIWCLKFAIEFLAVRQNSHSHSQLYLSRCDRGALSSREMHEHCNRRKDQSSALPRLRPAEQNPQTRESWKIRNISPGKLWDTRTNFSNSVLFWGRYARQRTLVIRIAAITLASGSFCNLS